MKLKLLVPDLVAIVGDQTSPTGVITSIKIIKNNTFFILETFGNFLETDLLVSGLTVSNGSFKDNVSLSWDAVSGVDGYKIFKNNTQEIATTTNTFFQDNIQQPGKLANYSVKTFVYLDGLEYRSKPVTLSGWRKLSEPIISSIIQTSPPEILINWLSVEGATEYKIYKATAPAIDQFSLYGATSSVFFSDKNIKEGVAYNYKIKASCALGDSDFSNIQSVLIQPTTPEAPTGVTASFGEFTNFIRVNWTPVNSIFYYNIYRDTSTNRIATGILDTEFIDTTAIQGVSYTYGIGAVNSSGEGPITFSNSGWLKLNPPSNFVASDGLFTNKIRLNWNSSDGASSYKIYKGTSPTEYQTVSGISYDDVGVTYGEIITYKVKAASNLSESDFSSQDTGFIAQLPPENFPTGVSASDGIFTDKIIINWNTATSIQGISGYKIFKNNNLLGVTQNTSFIDTPPAGICFEYKVKAFNNAGDGPESAGNTGWVNILPPSSLNASKQTAIQQITLNWSTSQGANFYKIFKGTPTSLSFLARTISTETQFIDSGLPIGTTFAYAVKASCSLGDSDFSPIDIGSTGFPVSLPDPPTGVSASDGAFTNKVNITWNSVSGISGYIVFADGTQIGATTNETIDHTPSPGQLINYTVASKNSAGIGSQSQGNTGWMKLTAPSILTASNNLSDRINLSWSPVSGATGYKVYLDPDTTAQLLGVTSNFSFTDINAVYGQARKYAVKASCTLGDSEYSPIAMGSVIQLAPETPPSGILASNGSFVDKVLVTWTPPITIMGISGYSVYKTNSLGVETVQNTTNTFLDDVSGAPGQTFEYKVSAFNLAGEGPRSIGDFGWKSIDVPSNLVASQGTFKDRIVLSWNAPQGTVNYKIYRGNPLIGITTTNSTNFIDLSAGQTPGTTFQYAVTAFSDQTIESTFSNSAIGFVGLEAPGSVVGLIGSETITEWLKDVVSGTDSLDMVFVGDSNVAFDNTTVRYEAQGLADNFVLAGICAGMRMYGSPVQFMAANGSNPITNSLGYQCFASGIQTNTTNGYTSGNAFGPDEFKNEFGISLSNWSASGHNPLGIFSGYAWAGSGQAVSSVANWNIGNTGGKTGLNTGLSLTCRMIIGSTGATGGGKIRFLGFHGPTRYIGDSPSDFIPITYTGGFTAYEKDCTRVMGNTALSFYLAGNPTTNFTATGPFGFAMSSFYNPVKGFATSSLAHMPGASLGAIYRACTLAGICGGNNTIVNGLREIYNRQVKAGGSGRVCIFVEGGVNLDSSPTASSLFMQNIVNFFNSEWNRAGLPSNKITFIGMNTWIVEPTSNWSVNQPVVISSMEQYAQSVPNFTYVDVTDFGGGNYEGWTAAGYYFPTGPAHLSSLGYKTLSMDVMSALLKSRVGLSASNGTYSDKILLSWNRVTGAQEYRVYSGSKTNKIGTTGFTFFADTTTPQGSTKDYYVSAALPDLVYETNKTGPVEGWRNINPPSGVKASKGEFSDKVKISWNIEPLATSYKVFTGLNFDTETGITLLGTVTNNEFFDTTASVGVGYTYAIKSSFNLGDSNYSNTDTGFIEGVHSEVLQYTQGIRDNYREKINGTFVPAPPRLAPWTGDIKYRPTNIKEVIQGLTAILGKNSSVTMGQNMFDNFHQTSYYYGIKGAPGNAVNSAVEQLIQKYDPAAWWVALDGTKGITLRGGTANLYVRHYSFNDLNSKPHPDWKSGVSDWDAANTIVWANSRNKLLYNLGEVDLLHTANNGIYRQLVDIAVAWRFLLQHNNSTSIDRTANPGLYKTELQARIFNQDILEKIKIILTELKSHYPITRPFNGVNKNVTFSWTNDPTTHGGRSGGIRISSGPIGATVDFDLGLGVNVNTWSPQGWTADQGESIYDHVGRDTLTDVLYLLTGATSDRPPEGISGGQRLQDDPSWDQLIKDIRMLLTKELYSHIKQTWEKRPWYIGGPREEYDAYAPGDLDNIGMITSNQWLEQLCCSIKTAMYLYEHAETNLEKTAIRECYNTLTEILAGFFERVLDSDPSIERAGIWPEGWNYALVAMPDVLYLLQDMKNMGDRRLWDTVTKRGAGVSYSHWTNNAWRWFHSRIMPNNLIINSSSVNSDQYSAGNIYNIAGIDLYHTAVLGSEYPEKGTPGSALAESLGIYKRLWGGSFRGNNNYFYELKKYAETPGVKPYRSYYRGNYFPDDQTFTWVSDFVMPDQQSTDPNQGYDPATNKQLTLTSKPFIFGIWGKGAGRFDAKAHRDEGHVSAYMGDAVILLEAGEIRNDTSASRQFFEKYAAGHNRMQLGEYKKQSWPRPAIITGVSFGNTGGSLFMDLTNSYNIRSLTASSGKYTLVQNGIGSPWGYEYNWADYRTSPSAFYQYQIGKVTRGISWAYEPYNKVSSTIRITDFAGISGICSGASGPTDRIYYRFLIGYTGATSGTDPGITILPISGTNNRVWNVGWTGPIGQNFIDGGYTCDYVGVTMTFTSTQPIQVSKLLVGTRSTKNSVNSSDFNKQTKSYALDIRLGLSGGAVHDETKVNLITQINSTVFRQNQAIVIPTETPQIRNYGAYNLNSITSLPVNTGCSSIFTAPTNRFPSWDVQISKLSGISLGRIMIDDFTILAARSGFTAPNTTWSC